MQPTNNKAQKRHSLSGQLLLWLMLCLFIILSISAVVSYARAYRFANLAYDRAIFRVALALAEQIDVADNHVFIDLPEIAKNLLEYDKDDYINYRISAPDGTLVVGSAGIMPPRQKIKSGDHLYYDDQLEGEQVRVVAYALPIINAQLKGDLLVQVTETRTKREFIVREIIEEMILPQLLMMLVTALVIFFSIKRSLLPLNQLKEALAKRSHLDLSPIATSQAPQEVTPLLEEMNALMVRVKQGVDAQKAFVADASHQLRTPITILQTQLELALREKAPEPIQHALQNLETTTQHLSRLVQQLLSLAKIEPNTHYHVAFTAVDLSTIAQEVTADWVPRAISKGLDLGFASESAHLKVTGNAFMLREMLSNLIENAICYTPQGGEITVTLSQQVTNQQVKEVVLSVIDSGIGIAPEQRALVFNRFYRIENGMGDGCGLGLAIVKEIASAHGANIAIHDGLPSVAKENGRAYGTHISIQFKAN